MTQNHIPRDINPFSHIIRFEERSERGQGDLVICDSVRQFYHECGHISTRTSCHNKQNIRFLQDASRNTNPPPHHAYPCTENFCDQCLTFDRYIQGSCPDCGRRGLATNLNLHPSFNGVTVIRSDPYMNVIPHDVRIRRREIYRKRALVSLFRIVRILIDDDSNYVETASIMVGDSDLLFTPYTLQYTPGALANRLDEKLYTAWIHRRSGEEERREIPLAQRTYYVCNQRRYTPLLQTVESTDNGVGKEQCPICRDPEYLLVQGDPRRLPCGHLFHWKCITDWIYQPTTHNCPYCRQEYIITELPRISPM